MVSERRGSHATAVIYAGKLSQRTAHPIMSIVQFRFRASPSNPQRISSTQSRNNKVDARSTVRSASTLIPQRNPEDTAISTAVPQPNGGARSSIPINPQRIPNLEQSSAAVVYFHLKYVQRAIAVADHPIARTSPAAEEGVRSSHRLKQMEQFSDSAIAVAVPQWKGGAPSIPINPQRIPISPDGNLANVLDSRSAIFKDRSLSFPEKNQLMKFFKLVQESVEIQVVSRNLVQTAIGQASAARQREEEQVQKLLWQNLKRSCESDRDREQVAMALALDEFGRPFIIIKEQEQKMRIRGLDAQKANISTGKAVALFLVSPVCREVVRTEQGTGCSIQPQNPTLSSEDFQSSVSEPSLTTGDALDKYRIILEKLENLVSCGVKETEIQGAIAEVPAIILRCKSQDEAALAVARKFFKGLYENASNIGLVSVHLAMLCSICDISKVVVKELTSWVIYSDEEQKFNKDITVRLIQSELLSLAEYNIHMAELINAERNKSATVFSISLIQTLLKIDSKAVLELQDLVDALGKLAARPGSHESLKQLVEIAKNSSANVMASSGASGWKEDNFKQSKKKKVAMLPPSGGDKSSFECVEPGPAGFHEQVSKRWRLCCPVVTYLPKSKADKKESLLGNTKDSIDESDVAKVVEEDMADSKEDVPVEWVSYWKLKFTVSLVDDFTRFTQNVVPPNIVIFLFCI